MDVSAGMVSALVSAPSLSPLESVLREHRGLVSSPFDVDAVCEMLRKCQAHPLPEKEREFLYYMLMMLREHPQRYSEQVMGLPTRSVRICQCYRYLPRPPHRRDYYLLLYQATGYCLQSINGIASELRAGDFCLIGPDALHSFSTSMDDCELYQIDFRKCILEAPIWFIENDRTAMARHIRNNMYANMSGYIVFHAGGDSKATLGIQKMLKASETEGETYNHMFMLAGLIETLGHLFRCPDDRVEYLYTSPKRSDLVEEMIEYIHANAATLTMAELAAHFHFSRVHVTRLLKDTTGHNFSQWITTKRIMRSAQLLTTTRESVSAIASRIGYENVNAYIRAFKKAYQVTPAAYRAASGGRGNGDVI